MLEALEPAKTRSNPPLGVGGGGKQLLEAPERDGAAKSASFGSSASEAAAASPVVPPLGFGAHQSPPRLPRLHYRALIIRFGRRKVRLM